MSAPQITLQTEAVRTLREEALRALSGDEMAFARLHQRLAGGLRRYIQRRTGGPAELVEDLTQTTWVEVWRALESQRYDPTRAAFSTFLYAVGAKVLARHRQAMARSAARRARVIREMQPQDMDLRVDPVEALHLAETLEVLREALEDAAGVLTAAERSIVIGIAEGQSERELSATLGIPSSTVHDRKGKAYAKLARYLVQPGTGREHDEE